MIYIQVCYPFFSPIATTSRGRLFSHQPNVSNFVEAIHELVSSLQSYIDPKGSHPDIYTWPDITQAHNTCHYYHHITEAKRIVKWDFFDIGNKTKKSDVTVVSQVSLDRLDRVSELMDHWDGPVSIAVHILPSHIPMLARYIVPLVLEPSKTIRTRLHLTCDLKETVR